MPRDDPDDILRTIRQIVRRISEHSRTLSRDVGLTVPQLLVLKAIGELEESAPIVTAARDAVDSGSIFKNGTTESVGGFIQNYLEVEDPELYRAVALALRAAKADGLDIGATGMAYKLS